MKLNLQTALYELHQLEKGASRAEDDKDFLNGIVQLEARAHLIVTHTYIFLLLSIPLISLPMLLPFIAYPILVAAMAGVSYFALLKRSLWVLPFLFFVAIFHPFADRRLLFQVGDCAITAGMFSGASLLLRGLLAAQSVLLMVKIKGFMSICHAFQRVGVPSVLVVQLMLVYRYLFVLLEEALWMFRARAARSYGQKRMPLSLWSVMVGQLLLRATDRATRIHQSMLVRGFDGHIAMRCVGRWTRKDTWYVVIWSVVLLGMRCINL